MADCVSSVAVEADGQGIVTGGNGVEALEETEDFTDGMIKIIADLDNRYSNMSFAENIGVCDIEERLNAIHDKVLSWDSDQSMIWDSDPEEASEYLQAVEEVRQLINNLESRHFNIEDGEQNELSRRAHSILQMAMAKLEEEFIHLLVKYQQSVEPDHMSFRSTEEDVVDDYSFSSYDEEPVEGKFQNDNSKGSEEFVIDLVHPGAISDLKCIAGIMFMSDYDKECCQAYISVRKDALDECLSVLRMERLSIEEVLRMDWSLLNGKIKRWNRAIKVFVRVYLASERCLCDLIFGDFSKSLRESCFVEISKGSILQLLNFGEAIAIGTPLPEKLFRILDMYEGLADLLADIEALFHEGFGTCILAESHEVLLRLGEAVRGTFTEFKNAIRTNTSTTPFAGGGIHPLTKYVMNYIKALADYRETLNSLLKDPGGKDRYSKSEDSGERSSLRNSSPIVRHLQSVTSILESNLDCRSMLYKDGSLQNFFMMNNICYMAQKVKDSDLRTILGDDWIRARNGKFQQHAISYERASWISVLSFLKDEGICNPSSSSPSKTVLKERFKGFNLAFEEVYRAQTAWVIHNAELREDLRISISLRVLQAYRTFMGRYSSHLDGVRTRDRYIKYFPDDLEKYLLDLFEGSPKSLQYPSQR